MGEEKHALIKLIVGSTKKENVMQITQENDFRKLMGSKIFSAFLIRNLEYSRNFLNSSLVSTTERTRENFSLIASFYFVQQENKRLKNESFTLLAGVCLSRFGETTTSCPVTNDPTGVDCTEKKKVLMFRN